MLSLLRFMGVFARFVLALGVGALTIARGVLTGLLLTGAVVHAHRRLAQGLRCPRGHLVQTEGATYTCGACAFTYEGGSLWLCENPECGATTPYVNCPTCGLSVPSPYRFLHR